MKSFACRLLYIIRIRFRPWTFTHEVYYQNNNVVLKVFLPIVKNSIFCSIPMAWSSKVCEAKYDTTIIHGCFFLWYFFVKVDIHCNLLVTKPYNMSGSCYVGFLYKNQTTKSWCYGNTYVITCRYNAALFLFCFPC